MQQAQPSAAADGATGTPGAEVAAACTPANVAGLPSVVATEVSPTRSVRSSPGDVAADERFARMRRQLKEMAAEHSKVRSACGVTVAGSCNLPYLTS